MKVVMFECDLVLLNEIFCSRRDSKIGFDKIFTPRFRCLILYCKGAKRVIIVA